MSTFDRRAKSRATAPSLWIRLSVALAFAAPLSATADLRFECPDDRLAVVKQSLDRYFNDRGLAPGTYVAEESAGSLTYRLAKPGTSTVTLSFDPALGIRDEQLKLPAGGGKYRTVSTVSRKEIVYAMMQGGRTTRFQGQACDAQAFIDHVGVRQMTVAWAEHLQWGWPEGGPAQWNERLWDKGTPRPGVNTFAAFNDVFQNPTAYAVGCYTATKFVMVQGALDYYGRVRADRSAAALVEQRLWENRDPLVGIEPRAMWAFESDFDKSEEHVPGKMLRLVHDVAPGNFIPGDWAYFLNTDPVSYEKTGYEGSNTIYLGRNRFNDHYADNGGHYLYLEKMRMVYNWRNKVFSRSRDYARIEPLSSAEVYRLERTPEEGGFLLPYRAVPYYFGFEALPSVAP